MARRKKEERKQVIEVSKSSIWKLKKHIYQLLFFLETMTAEVRKEMETEHKRSKNILQLHMLHIMYVRYCHPITLRHDFSTLTISWL